MNKFCLALVLFSSGCGNSPSEEPVYEFAAAKEDIFPTGYDLVTQFNQSVLDASQQARYGEKVNALYFDGVPPEALRHISERELSSAFVSNFLSHNYVGTAIVPLLDGKVATITGSTSHFDLQIRDIKYPCQQEMVQGVWRCPDLKAPVYILYKRVKKDLE